MSKTANWAYVADCTAWKRQEGDGWEEDDHWSSPIPIKAAYLGKSQRVINSTGQEITVSFEFMTEYPELSEGDRIAIGKNADINTSQEITAVDRTIDLFYRQADDYSYYT